MRKDCVGIAFLGTWSHFVSLRAHGSMYNGEDGCDLDPLSLDPELSAPRLCHILSHLKGRIVCMFFAEDSFPGSPSPGRVCGSCHLPLLLSLGIESVLWEITTMGKMERHKEHPRVHMSPSGQPCGPLGNRW